MSDKVNIVYKDLSPQDRLDMAADIIAGIIVRKVSIEEEKARNTESSFIAPIDSLDNQKQ